MFICFKYGVVCGCRYERRYDTRRRFCNCVLETSIGSPLLNVACFGGVATLVVVFNSTFQLNTDVYLR